MDLSRGFAIEDPAVFIPWAATADEIVALLPTTPRHVTTGYLTTECTSLHGMRHVLGLHFHPRIDGRLDELEFFRQDGLALDQSFWEWQEHLERAFGSPTSHAEGDEGYPQYAWQISEAQVRHLVQYRFGPEEHVRITRYQPA
jgi:hypothetical protein